MKNQKLLIRQSLVASLVFLGVHVVISWIFTRQFDITYSMISTVIFFAVFHFMAKSIFDIK